MSDCGMYSIREYESYQSWKRAVKKLHADAFFHNQAIMLTGMVIKVGLK
jgi:hypothetical protein